MQIESLAFFSGKPVFKKPRSTSNLIKPNKGKFIEYVKKSYNTGKINSNGPLISEFERRFADLHGAKFCVSVCNGLWGLVLTIKAIKIHDKNEIIMPSLTYRRMADIAAWLKLIPHFCDVDSKSLGISPKYVEKCINENTSLILAPHPIVNLCDVEGIEKLANKYNLPLIFDSVESYYAEINNKKIGSFGDAECFSLHASKFFNGFEGGYVTTNNQELANVLKYYRNNGFDNNGQFKGWGMNAGLMDYHAALGLASLDEVELQVNKNKERFLNYQDLLKNILGIELVEYSFKEKRSYKNILVKLNSDWKLSREMTINLLQAENMIVRPYYYPPLHQKNSSYKTITSEMNNTNYLKDRFLLLPCGEFVDSEDIKIIAAYLSFINTNAEEIKNRINEISK